jgi:hypothetical protein
MKLNHWIVLVVGSALTAVAVAKLPAPVLTEEQKVKADEAKAKAADAAKKAAADEQRYQDRVADRYFKEAKAAGKNPVPPQWVAPAPVVAVATAQAAPGQKQATPTKASTSVNLPATKASGGAKTTQAKS